MTKVELFEGDRAAYYDSFVDAWIPNYRYFISMVPKLLEDINDKNLLVAGCGTGNEIMAFGESLSGWNITGVDPSIEMLEQARHRLKAHSHVHLVHSRIDQLPQSIHYSGATLLLVLHFMPDDGSKLSLLKDIGQRLSPQAPFVLLDITGDEEQMTNNLNILTQLLPSSMDKKEIQNRVNRIKSDLYAVSENRLSELLQEAGFEKPTRFFQSTVYMGWITTKK